MDIHKRKIAVSVGNAEKSALEAVYKTLLEHQMLDHIHVTFFPNGIEGLQKALEETSSGFDALIAMPLQGVNISEIWRQNLSIPRHALQISTCGNFRYVKLFTDSAILPDIDQIATRLEHFSEVLKSTFRLPLPRLAVMSTSKTSDGKTTKEDKEYLLPAIQKAFEKLIPVFGAFSNDTFFASENYLRFDGFCFVNQEQVDAMLRQFDGINILFEADAPMVLATPMTTNPNAEELFRETLYLVKDMINNKKEYEELNKNPLKFELERKNNEFQAF